MKRLSLVLAIASLALPQSGKAGWFRTYGGSGWDEGRCVQEVDDGYIVTGFTQLDSLENSSLWLLKTDTLGKVIWSKTYGGTSSLGDKGHFVNKTSDGGYIVAGQKWTDSYRIWLLKTDAEGDTLWTRTFGESIGYCAHQTPDGGYIVTGQKGWFPTQLFLFKTRPEGDSLWMQTYLLNGWVYSAGYFVEPTEDNGFVVAGLIGDTLDGQEKTALWVIKTDSLGDTLWTYTQGGEDWNHWERARCVRPIEGGYIVLANFGLLKLNISGDTLWTRNYAGGSCVQETSDKGFIITGTPGSVFSNTSTLQYSANSIWLLKTKNQGDSLWKQIYGDGQGYHVEETRDTGFIVTGNNYNNLWDLILLKTDSLGLLGITEHPIVEADNGWNVPHSIGSYVVLHYQGLPEGFRANVFDVTGRKVDQIRGDGNKGAMTWGINYLPGVYFIQAPCTRRNENGSNLKTVKVEIIR